MNAKDETHRMLDNAIEVYTDSARTFSQEEVEDAYTNLWDAIDLHAAACVAEARAPLMLLEGVADLCGEGVAFHVGSGDKISVRNRERYSEERLEGGGYLYRRAGIFGDSEAISREQAAALLAEWNLAAAAKETP